MDKNILFQAFEKMSKEELISHLKTAYDNLEGKPQRSAFGDLYKELVKLELSPEELLGDIEGFHSLSLEGFYYDSFRINSKNFSDVPEETDKWFDELSNYLDYTSELVKKEQYATALACFKMLFELIEKMEDGEEIVFAHELGDWMITAESDYLENYIITLVNNTVSVEEYAKRIIPLIKSGIYVSFSSKAYQKVKKHSSPEQLAAIKAEIKAQGIRTR